MFANAVTIMRLTELSKYLPERLNINSLSQAVIDLWQGTLAKNAIISLLLAINYLQVLE